MGTIYYHECLDHQIGVQVGKHPYLLDHDFPQETLDDYQMTIPGKNESDGVVGAIVDAIEGSDFIEYYLFPKKLLHKIVASHIKSIREKKLDTSAEYGYWNEASSNHNFDRDVIGFLFKHRHCGRLSWQENGHFFSSRGLPTFHHDTRPG